MNKGHINKGEIVNLESLHKELDPGATHALVRTKDMEVIRMVIPEGKRIPEHQTDGQISLQCLQGDIHFEFEGNSRYLTAGDWLFLEGNTPHALHAREDSVLLLTILFAN